MNELLSILRALLRTAAGMFACVAGLFVLLAAILFSLRHRRSQ